MKRLISIFVVLFMLYCGSVFAQDNTAPTAGWKQFKPGDGVSQEVQKNNGWYTNETARNNSINKSDNTHFIGKEMKKNTITEAGK